MQFSTVRFETGSEEFFRAKQFLECKTATPFFLSEKWKAITSSRRPGLHQCNSRNNFTKVSFCHRAMSHRSRTKASVDRHGYSGRLNKTKDKLEDVDVIALRDHWFSLWPDRRAYLIIFIRRVTLNTELDTVFLFVRHGQRTHFGVYPLVCPFSTWPGQGFYVELFLIGALNRLQRWQRSRAFLAQTSTYKGNVLCFFAEK